MVARQAADRGGPRAGLYAGLLDEASKGESDGAACAETGDGHGFRQLASSFLADIRRSICSARGWSCSGSGATIDDALGEAYDKVATILGVPFPGGPNLDRLAQTPGANDRIEDLPISRLSPTSLDFSFSGLKTAMLYQVRGVPEHPAHKRGVSLRGSPPLTDERRRDLAATFQRAAVRTVTLKLERALDQLRQRGVYPKSLLTGGGVTANTRLRNELVAFASAQRPRSLCRGWRTAWITRPCSRDWPFTTCRRGVPAT